MAAAALLFFVYLGFEEIANLVELVALAIVHMASSVELATSHAPLSTAMNSLWPRLVIILSGIALFATANTVLITVIAASQLSFSMARDGEIYGIFAGLLSRRHTPWVAVILAFVMSAVMPWIWSLFRPLVSICSMRSSSSVCWPFGYFERQTGRNSPRSGTPLVGNGGTAAIRCSAVNG